jgi:hypothetical protein
MNMKIIAIDESAARPRQDSAWKRCWQRCMHYFKESRACERVAARTAAEIRWTDTNGACRLMQTVCIDISPGGIGVLSREPLPDQVEVQVNVRDRIVKHARIRHTQRIGEGYLSGLQFMTAR